MSRFRSVLVACVLSLGLLTIAAPASSAATDTGWIRLAHLSPNTPAVDVYLYSFKNPNARLVLHHVSYGTVSPYLPAAAGVYTVAMRLAGASASSPPVLSTAVTVEAGHAYTVAGMGPKAGLRLEVLPDVLTAPPGRTMIQVIQASMRQDRVTVLAGSDVLGRDLAFASATPFKAMSGGRYTVRAAGESERAADSASLHAGSIHTLVILDVPGHLKIVDLTDAVGSKVIPAEAPATGLGGTAPVQGPSIAGWLTLLSAGLLVAAGGLVGLRRSRRLVRPVR
jgi:hypothetical protein